MDLWNTTQSQEDHLFPHNQTLTVIDITVLMLQNADVSANATFIATIQKLGDLTFDKEILGVLAPREYKMPRSQGLRESFEHQAV